MLGQVVLAVDGDFLADLQLLGQPWLIKKIDHDNIMINSHLEAHPALVIAKKVLVWGGGDDPLQHDLLAVHQLVQRQAGQFVITVREIEEQVIDAADA